MNSLSNGWKRLCVAFWMLTGLSGLAAEPPAVPVFNDQWLVPFWKSETSYQETIFFAQRHENEPATARLVFPPTKILSVASATGEVTYEEGKDYRIDADAGTVALLAGSRIPSKTLAEMYPTKESSLPKIACKKGDAQTCLIWSEGTFFHKLQVVVTYTHAAGLWQGYTPQFAGAQLPKTMARLRQKQPLILGVSGDSISAGYNASGFTKAPPFVPRYSDLVQLGLEKKYGSKVTLKNFAVPGWQSGNGVKDAPRLAAEKPELVIIAYGMNDVSRRNPTLYAGNIKQIMQEISRQSPDAEFILVASMIGNPEWNPMSTDQFLLYRDALAKLCGPGVVLADMTSVWEEMLKRKSFHDLTGNGVNHPNDFGHRAYAQVILSLLGGS